MSIKILGNFRQRLFPPAGNWITIYSCWGKRPFWRLDEDRWRWNPWSIDQGKSLTPSGLAAKLKFSEKSVNFFMDKMRKEGKLETA